MDYVGNVKKLLVGVNANDEVKVTSKGEVFTGMLMPRGEAVDDVLVLKLSNGYNIGLVPSKIELVKKAEALIPKSRAFKPDVKKKNIVILGAGGTIASKVDYRVGGVKPAMTAEEIISFTPAIHEVANIKARVLFQMLSECMTSKQWSIIASEIKKEVDAGADGIVVMHGTDVMGYTSAYLSFALKDLSVPVVLVGSQRSTDRASCDTHMNITCAVKAATTDIAEVMVCMHEDLNDDSCVLHQGNRVRKCHSSRRDAFRSIGVKPYARIKYPSLEVSILRDDYTRRDMSRRIDLRAGFDDKVALIKSYPGMKPDVIQALTKAGYHGIVFEGTGLGHLPIKGYGDEFTANNELVFKALKEFAKVGIVFMSPQTIWGRIEMSVYETGRDLLSAGMLGNLQDTLGETAYAKLVWALGNSKTVDEAKKLMSSCINGEFTQRSEVMP